MEVLKEKVTSSRLALILPKNPEHQYLVSILFDKEKDGNSRIDYVVDIEYLEMKDKQLALRVFKHSFFINRKEPNLILEELLSEINNALYPIDIIIDHKGAFKDVTNMEEIKKRWSKKKSKLQLEYNSKITDSVFLQIDKVLRSEDSFKISLSKDIFWNIFFHKIYKYYGEDYQIKENMSFPIELYDTPYIYSGTNVLSKVASNSNTKVVTYSGILDIPKYSKLYEGKEECKLISRIKVKYDLNMTDNTPVWIKANCDIVDTVTNMKLRDINIQVMRQYNPLD